MSQSILRRNDWSIFIILLTVGTVSYTHLTLPTNREV